MAGRIITLQRQARELGRLRTGYSIPNEDPKKRPRPVRSSTWIITSHAEHYVHAAAEIWGGTVEKWQPQGNGAVQWRVTTEAVSLDAILPPGDPLSQAYESWSRGGAQRRCDGMTETLSDQPCLCRAQWGDNFHETAPRDLACKMTTRLNVILPEMPDIGAWRVETHSYHSANEIAAAVDVLKGSIGSEALIPVRLRIEQRTRVAQGKTKQFPVVAVELRGATAGQVLSGAVRVEATGAGLPMAAVGGGEEGQAAIEGPRPALAPAEGASVPSAEDFIAAARGSASLDDLSVNLAAAQQAGFARQLLDPEDPVAVAFMARRAELQPAPPATPAAPEPPGRPAQQSAAAPPVESEEADLLWQRIVAAWPGTTSELKDRFTRETGGVEPQNASEQELDDFLRRLRAGEFNQPASGSPSGDGVPF